MKNSKTKLLLGFILFFVLIIIGIVGYRLFSKKQTIESAQQENRKIEPVNQISITERPFIQIYPRKDGREVTILVDQYQKSTSVEYELEYEAGSLLQGAFGQIDFTTESPPVQRNLLLGSCSAGGKCSYHEDVNGGTLVLRYKNGETTKLKGEWNFQNMQEQQGSFNSRDAKFTFDVGKTGLPANTSVIVAQTFGLPGSVDGEILAGPYQVKLPVGDSVRNKQIKLSLRPFEANADAKLLGWVEDGWKEYQSTITEKTLSAIVDQPTTFVVVSSSVSSGK